MKNNSGQYTWPPQQPSSSSYPSMSNSNGAEKTWGVPITGTSTDTASRPTAPFSGSNANNATAGGANQHHQYYLQHPYIHYSPVSKQSGTPMDSAFHALNSWGNKAETMANNIWKNLKTGTSVSTTAWGKVNLTAKAISGGGYESLYKQTFTTHPGEILNKTFACYFSTSNGPITGTMFLSNAHVAFCSDNPLFFSSSSSGQQQTWNYYKLMVPLSKIVSIKPLIIREISSEKYIKITTIDGHDFWFMGFVSYEKACIHLSESLSKFIATGIAVHPNRL